RTSWGDSTASARISGPAHPVLAASRSRAGVAPPAVTTRERSTGERQAATVPRGFAQGRLPGPGRAHPRVLALRAHLRTEPRVASRRAPVRVLRRAAHGQRPAGRPPRALARL